MKRSVSEQEWKDLHDEHHAQVGSGNPAVYVSTYGKYNNCSLDGMWVDLTTFYDYDEFMEFLRLLHDDELDPEFMFQDYEGFPEDWYSESGMNREMFDKIQRFADLTDNDRSIVMAYAEATGSTDIDAALDRHEGEWDSEEDFAEHLFEEFYSSSVPEFIRYYFDTKSYARDIFCTDYSYCDGHVFRRF